LRSALSTLLLVASAAALAQDASATRDIQRALIQREQQSAEFAAQIHGGPDARRAMEALHERQLREAGTPQSANPDVVRELLPYERQRLSSESETVLRLTPPAERPLTGAFAKPLPLPGGPRPRVEPVAPPGVGG
jgi:hypothetical protein